MNNSTSIEIKLIKSQIKIHSNQKKILEALGLKRIGKEKIIEKKPDLIGMVNKVKHLLKIREII